MISEPLCHRLPTALQSCLSAMQMEIARFDGARISRLVSAKGNLQAAVQIELPDGEYLLTHSLYSSTKQASGQPCGIRTAREFKGLTWETALQWCNIVPQELRALTSPFLWIEGTQTAMYPAKQPVSLSKSTAGRGVNVVSLHSPPTINPTYTFIFCDDCRGCP